MQKKGKKGQKLSGFRQNNHGLDFRDGFLHGGIHLGRNNFWLIGFETKKTRLPLCLFPSPFLVTLLLVDFGDSVGTSGRGRCSGDIFVGGADTVEVVLRLIGDPPFVLDIVPTALIGVRGVMGRVLVEMVNGINPPGLNISSWVVDPPPGVTVIPAGCAPSVSACGDEKDVWP